MNLELSKREMRRRKNCRQTSNLEEVTDHDEDRGIKTGNGVGQDFSEEP